MENAAEALQMAAAVLIFVLALSISINAFGEARITAETILNYQDKEYDYTYVEENTDADGNVSTERIVGIETVIPSIYKAYKEHYKIVFENIGDDGVYTATDEHGNRQVVNSIDLQNESLGSEEQRLQFINALIYGSRLDNFIDIKENFAKISRVYLNDTGIYDKIMRSKVKENIGIFYEDEATSDEDSTSDDEESDVPDANKTTKRVITYTLL